MSSIQDTTSIKPFVNNYWWEVQFILNQKFKWPLEHAEIRISEAIRDLQTMDDAAQVIFYHAEPYDVAEDFAAEGFEEFEQDQIHRLRAEWIR